MGIWRLYGTYLLNGEVVLIKQTGFDYDGDVYAVDWDGQTYIKKVYREEDGLRLVSLNKRYGDKFAPYDEDPRIIGKLLVTSCRLRLSQVITIGHPKLNLL